MSQAYKPLVDESKFTDEDIHRDTRNDWRDTSDNIEHNVSVRSQRNGKLIWIIHAGLLCLSLTLFTSAYFTNVSTLRYVRQYSAYSPAAEAIEYESIRYNLSMGTMSPFTGFGPKVDEAWRRISYDMGDQMITEDELDILEMPKSALKVKHPQTGVEGYRVGLEAFHQLHCLDLLRQVTYKDWYGDIAGDLKDPNMLQMHTDHCIEVLRLNIQCTADIGLFTFYMVDGDPLPWPELNSKHTCRKFDKVVDWATRNSVGNMEKDIELAV